MAGPLPAHLWEASVAHRSTKQIDADIERARQDRAKVKAHIEQRLASVAELRTLYATIGTRLDGYLEERTASLVADLMTVPTAPRPAGRGTPRPGAGPPLYTHTDPSPHQP